MTPSFGVRVGRARSQGRDETSTPPFERAAQWEYAFNRAS